MNKVIEAIRVWFNKEPTSIETSTVNIDQAIKELKELNLRQTEVLNKVDQPDILRSLVISMNSGRNK